MLLLLLQLSPQDNGCATNSCRYTYTSCFTCRSGVFLQVVFLSIPLPALFSVSMNTPHLLRRRESETKKKPISAVAHTSHYMAPLIWCFKVYDKHFESRLQRAPDELARIVKGEPPLAPLPKLRKRSLTHPLPPIESIQKLSSSIRRSRQITQNQEASFFLTKLPYELRLLIYGEVLAGGSENLVHLLRKYDRLGHWRCRMQDSEELCDAKGERCVEGWLKYKRNVWHMDKIGRIDLITDGRVIDLLCTCRVMYVSTPYLASIPNNTWAVTRRASKFCTLKTSFISTILGMSDILAKQSSPAASIPYSQSTLTGKEHSASSIPTIHFPNTMMWNG